MSGRGRRRPTSPLALGTGSAAACQTHWGSGIHRETPQSGVAPHRRSKEGRVRIWADMTSGQEQRLATRLPCKGPVELVKPNRPYRTIYKSGVAITAARSHAEELFHLFLIKPSHYDDEGYVIQWARSSIPANTLATLYGLALDGARRRVLGGHVEIRITAWDET